MEKNGINSELQPDHREDADRLSIDKASSNGYNSGDHVAEEAKGGHLSDMPKGYYTNWRFIGTIAAVSFMAQGLYLGQYSPAT